MNRIFRILVLAATLAFGVTTISAQTVQVIATQKVMNLPTTVTSYLDDPLYYFDVNFIVTGSGTAGVDIFFDMSFRVTTSSFYVQTNPNTIPPEFIHLREGSNPMSKAILENQMHHRIDTNMDYSDLMSLLQLPEGTYTLCFNIYRWEDRFVPVQNREKLNDDYCPEFEICYSGSAPELVSPLAGAEIGMDGEMVVKPTRKVNFFWTPVISNCSTNNTRFRYMLKMVKVFDGQNYQDAIRYNPTVFSAETRNNTYVVLDTLRDVKVQLERGAMYVVQVQAQQIETARDETFIVANDGVSQPMPFYWGYSDDMYTRTYKTSMKDEADKEKEKKGMSGLTQWEGGIKTVSQLDTIKEKMKKQYLASFIQDVDAVNSLTAKYPEEMRYVPTPKHHYVESDGYYTVPMTDDLEVSFMPTRHSSLKKTSYSIELFNYKKGGMDSITSKEPLLVEFIEDVPDSYNKPNSHEMVSRTLAGWGAKLNQGSRYYLQLSCQYDVDYWKYTVSDTSYYVNDLLAEQSHDTLSRDFVSETLKFSNGVCFQWGDNPDMPAFDTPQWTAPVDCSGADVYDPTSYELPTAVPEVKKGKSFPVSWTPITIVTEGDKAEYEVKVYELKHGQTVKEAIATNKVLVSRTVSDANEIAESDAKFFKVFSHKKTYVMTLTTKVKCENGSYHFKNGNEAIPAVFKVVK